MSTLCHCEEGVQRLTWQSLSEGTEGLERIGLMSSLLADAGSFPFAALRVRINSAYADTKQFVIARK